ncbi:LacI family transcriptional regulator [Uruburuella testudinis]|uniref:LacI family transcriptional regulator n=1 Tax=Uruburuella testudinis TaxID=1282863 RepID=A0ABY4DQ09_9NEIS|nr:LacI family DNA-binding transcriptional regulator [Uruburuella testudinis]UOO80966.1 LacI family transcriptional regulator [Uruburuella testudinis]
MTTIYDVARHAGVSAKTVSRVLNNDAPVKPETREAVQKAIGELGYIPSSAARMMRSNRSGLIGLITGAISQSSARTDTAHQPRGLSDMLLVQGALQTISASGKTLMIADTGGDADKVAPLIRTFLQHRVEGILYVADQHKEVALPKVPDDCPIVLLNCFDRLNTPSVLPDDANGQKQLVEALIGHGHRRIAYLTLPPDVIATRLRAEGYRAALAAAGIGYDADLLVAGYPNQNNDSRDLWNAIEHLMTLAKPPSVICCGNDEMALRVYGILRTRGLRIPEEISVVGYDNDVSITETLFPPLSTAVLPYYEMGMQAGKILLELASGKPAKKTAPNPLIIPSEVAWRSSVITIDR